MLFYLHVSPTILLIYPLHILQFFLSYFPFKLLLTFSSCKVVPVLSTTLSLCFTAFQSWFLASESHLNSFPWCPYNKECCYWCIQWPLSPPRFSVTPFCPLNQLIGPFIFLMTFLFHFISLIILDVIVKLFCLSWADHLIPTNLPSRAGDYDSQ